MEHYDRIPITNPKQGDNLWCFCRIAIIIALDFSVSNVFEEMLFTTLIANVANMWFHLANVVETGIRT